MDIEQKQEEPRLSVAPPSPPSSPRPPRTLSFSPSPRFSPSLMFFSLKEQKILCTWMCFVFLHMAHGVITRHASESQRKRKIGPKLLTSLIYGLNRQIYDVGCIDPSLRFHNSPIIAASQ